MDFAFQYWITFGFVLAVIAALCFAARVSQLKKDLEHMTADRDDWRREERNAAERAREAKAQAVRWKNRCDALQEEVSCLEQKIHL